MTSTITQDTDSFAEHVFGAALHAHELFAAYAGDRLGWYRALAEGDATPAELAERTGTAERYAREWLEHQAVAGWLEVVDDGAPQRRYRLPTAVREVLTDPDSLAFLAPLARFVVGSLVQAPALLEAYRTGGGVTWSEFGADAREAQADMNRPWFLHELPGALSGTAAVDDVLRRPGARVVDVGCGGGWSTIAIADAYPGATVTGIDVDAASIDLARANAAASGVDDRVTFAVAEAGALDGTFDAAFLFECLHDMPHPVQVLADVRRLVGGDGLVVVMDEAVGDELAAPGDDVERLMYGFSLSVCLPDGLAHEHSAGTGTVMRPSVVRRYAREAGFGGVEVLPIEDFAFFRFYRLAA